MHAAMKFRISRSYSTMLLALLALLPLTLAYTVPAGFIEYGESDGTEILLPINRKPALYTSDYGSCLSNNLVTVTRFDAAYYHDNMTVIFDIEGYSNLTSEAVMVYIGVYAYGESRFELSFNPCNANIYSMCPIKNNVTIEAHGTIPLGQSDVADIPNLAYSIPDFEGQAILRIFANATESEITCYSAVVTNGATFSQPKSVGTILGIFAFIAMAASFVTAIYGSDIPTMRTHYAHSLSVLVVFAVYHHIFFTGALSMNWPSVLVAFWSNYAWSAGMIYSDSMQNAIDKLTATHRGNTTSLGAAGAGTWASNVGGGYNIHQIYKRSSLKYGPFAQSTFEKLLSRRAASSGSDNLTTTQYMGHLVRDGLPLPGNYSGFPGTLYEEGIPVSNAFLTGFIWFLILLVIIAACVPLSKYAIDLLCKARIVKTERFNYFRTHWIGYTVAAVLKTCYISFFSMMFFTIFQFSYGGAAAVEAIAAIVFVLFLVGVPGIVAYAIWYRLKMTDSHIEPNMLWGFVPAFRIQETPRTVETSRPMEGVKEELITELKISTPDDKPKGELLWKESDTAVATKSVHNDEHYTKRFGWLASRHRQTKWWFFAIWLFYEFVRACFFAAPSGYAMVQVFGLLAIEFIAFVAIISIRPFEGQRLNIIVVYLLGFSKVTTVALSAAFDVSFNLQRITTTIIGIVIIVIQGVLTIVLMIAVIMSAVTSYYSVMRYRETIRPRRWNPSRTKYLAYLEKAPRDRPMTPPPPRMPSPERPKGPYFSVNSVRRAPKIEDEDAEFMAEIASDPRLSDTFVNYHSNNGSVRYSHEELAGSRVSRAMSTASRKSSTNLPYGARLHRGSWSTKDFSEFNASSGFLDTQAVTTTSLGDSESIRPIARQYSGHMRRHGSRDSVGGQSIGGFSYSYSRPATSGHSRNLSNLSGFANAHTTAEEATRPHTVSSDHGSAPASPISSPDASVGDLVSKVSAQLDEDATLNSRTIVSETSATPLFPLRESSFARPSNMDLTGTTVLSDENKRPIPAPINTALADLKDGAATPPRPQSPRSPGSPRSPRKARLQKQRPRDSIDEGNERDL